MSLKRTLEPESMSDHEEAMIYSEMSFAAVNQAFVDDFLACAGAPDPGCSIGPKIIDFGCGPGDIPVRLCKTDGTFRVLAIDSSIEMLDLARRWIDFGGMLERITLAHADCKNLENFADDIADAVISNSLLHHLPEPALGLDEAVRVLRPGGLLFIRDLVRPSSAEQVEELVKLHSEGENDIARQLLRQSFHAALTLAEIRELADDWSITAACVQMTSDRHWTLAWWKPLA